MDEEHPKAASIERAEDGWLRLEYPGNPVIRLDCRILDRILAEDNNLILTVDDVTAVIGIAGGFECAALIATELSPYTRSASIVRREDYVYAKRRLQAALMGRVHELPPALYVGEQSVVASRDIVYIGDSAFRISDVHYYAVHGFHIPLDDGIIRAALPLLVVAATERREDTETLAARIEDYERRNPT